ncbi:gliding motility-associated C-terminal domain-containing protein [Flavobacterium sp. DGU38]|uniref:Gliding motility-associated C-terminal domain-containing protein n=1 Tax=Flavobacterium calami TaxID=3139144 RepID=A0ABU9ILY5_9FLAO
MEIITYFFKNINIKGFFTAFLLIFITNGYSQNTFDGDYCPGPGTVGDEYATGTVYNNVLLASPSSTCQIGTIRAKVDTQNQVLRLGMDIGNGGSALFRLYLDTNNNPLTGLTSDSFGGNISVAGAEYILEINSNGNGFTLYTGNGSVKTQTNVIPPGLAAQAGNANCNSGATFLEFNIPFGSLGINICDPNNPGIINITKLASVSGNSPSSNQCINTPLTFGIPLKGTVGPSTTICSGASSALTITGLNANSTVSKWQSSVAPFSVWADIPNTAGLTAYNTGNLTETTLFRAIFSNSGLCSGNDIATSEATVTVNAPTGCSITGTSGPVCLSSSNVYTAPANMTTYAWSLPSATANGATITSASNAQSVTVLAGSTCNTTFKLLLTTTLNGCSSTCEKIVTVNDTTAPTWTTAAASLNVTLQCSDVSGLATAQASFPVATDNCGGTVTYTKISGSFMAGSCINSGTYTNTWEAKDVCSNTSTIFTQTISIEDTTAPMWTTAAASLDVTLQCSDLSGLATAQTLAPIATDNCGGTLTYTKISGSFIAGSCINSGTYTNTWQAKDVCLNTSTVFTQVITIEDTTAPMWTTAAGALDVTLQCSDLSGLATAQNAAPIATDNCGGTVTYTKISGSFIAGSCINSGTYTNTWEAKDVCLNTSTVFTQVITIEDTTAPMWTTASASLDVTLQCSDLSGLANAQAAAPIATDNCGGTVTYTKISGSFIAGSCINSGTYTNTWEAKDVCLNTSTVFTQVITIEDTTAPMWTTAAGALDVTLQCSDLSGLATAQNAAPIATDNCGGTLTYTKISGSFIAGSCINSGTYTNTWQAKDVCLNTSTVFTQVITIEDTTAPMWTTASGALDVTLQCSDVSGLATAQASFPVATDNCGGTITYTKISGSFIAGSCINSGTYTNTWEAKDVCLNTSTIFTQTITIEDTTAPMWTTAAGALDVTLQCSDVSGLATAQASFPVATDNCGGTVTYTKISGSFIASSCINSGTYTNTWEAKDVCLNTSTVFTQVITIEDTTAPMWTTATGALDVTLQCSDLSGLATAQAAAPIATDNCGGTVTYTKISGSFTAGSCVNSGTYTNTWEAKDICLNTSTIFTQTITIEDTTAPMWTTAAGALDVTLQCSDVSGLATAQASFPVATDNCGGTVTYTKISGSFMAGSCINSGTYINTWEAKDMCLNTSTIFTQTITIEDTTAPMWTTAAGALDVTLQCSDVSGLATAQASFPVATDNCGGTVTYTKISGSFIAGSCINSGTYTNTWEVKDMCLNTSTVFTQVITIEDTTAPMWTTAAASLDVTLQCSDLSGLATAQTLAPIATDNCGGTVTYTKISGSFMAGSCINSGTYTNTWEAKDVCLNTSTVFTQVITIEDTTAPMWTTLAGALDVTLQCSDVSGLATAQASFPVATDNCGETVTYTKISGNFVAGSCINSGTYTNTWEAKDVCLNTSTIFTQTITIEDTTAPMWTTAAASLDVTLQCSDVSGLATAQTAAPIATDNCGGTVTYTKISGSFMAGSCINSGTYTNTWEAKDVCLNTSTIFTQTISIEDTTAPMWTTAAGALDVTLQCSDTAGLINAQAMAPIATDNCDGTITYTKTSGTLQRGSCGSTGTYTNTWIAKDICENTSTVFTQVITIEDNAAPNWITEAGTLNITLQCSDTAGLQAAQNQTPVASANCTIVTYIKTSGEFNASQDCANAGTYTNSWIAKDDCGNVTDSFIQVITIEDTTAPTWATEMASLNMTLQCSDTAGLALAQALFPTASDLCDADVSNIVKVSGQFMASEGCGNAGTYTNTWTVKDDCGNTSDTFTQVITIEDTTAPTWATEMNSLNMTLQCSDTAGLALAQALFPTASDLCDADVSNIVKVSGQFMASEGCGNSGTYTNTWTVKDDCGNTSDTFTQVITIEDTTAPTWATEMNSLNMTLQCSDTAGLALAQALFPTASDLCDADVSNIVKVSGQFMASEGCGNSGTYTNTWTVKDDCGNTSDTFTQVITIEDTTAPTWATETGSLNMTLQCSDTAGLALAQALFPTASDLCDNDVSNIVKVSGQFMASEGCGNSGTYTNTWTVKDDCGNTSDTFTQVITIEDTTAPTWATEMASLNMTLQCSDTAGLALAQAMFPTASDLCDNDISNIVKVSGQFMASEGCGNAGTYTNTWTVKDDCGNTSDTFTQVITIEDTTAPTWATETGSLNMTLQCSDTAGLALAQALFPTASDLCDADVSNIVKVSGQFMASEGCGNSGSYTNTWTVKDDCGNTSDTFTQVITIEDTTAPTWATEINSLNMTLQCSDTAGLALAQALFPTASDLCDADVSNIVKISGQFMASEGCSNAGTYTNTWTVKDDCGNTSDIFTQVITLEDTTVPMFTGNLPSDITVSCDAVPEPATLKVFDNCNSNLPVVFSETKSNIQNECPTNYTLTRIWSTSDCSGNTVSHFQIITVRDTTAPTGTAPASVANLQNIANIPAGSPQDIIDAADNCSGSVNISITDSNNGGSGCDGNAYILTRTYTLTDCAGNKTELVQTFTVENKISVMGTASNVTCFEGNNGSILVTSSPGSVVVIRNQNNEVVGNTNLRAGVYTLTATAQVNNNNQVCSSTATVTITQPENVIVNLNSEACNADSSPLNLSSLLPEGISRTGIWTDTSGTNALQGNILNVFGLALGSYTLEYKTTNEDCPRSVSVNLLVNDDCRVLACEKVLVHNAFSPNGDGVNDFFKIDNIDLTTCYPENTVEVYNRWGILVFETTNYNNITNAFDGTSRGRTTIKQSEGLPTGTYFYILTYKSFDNNNVARTNKQDGYLYLSK